MPRQRKHVKKHQKVTRVAALAMGVLHQIALLANINMIPAITSSVPTEQYRQLVPIEFSG
ncbi:MAG: hypothetical protein D6767_07135 [Candidatus Hydrogenedentota bacterium]|nr:MAG: hypothetical protein D6767_07135 [Candidatus Hydrogenedentota bacterium]